MKLARVADVHDPMKAGRVRVELPSVYGSGRDNWSPWALLSTPTGIFTGFYEGDSVWVDFRNGDIRQPIVVGFASLFNERSPAFLRELSSGTLQASLRDASDHNSAFDYADHLKSHDHENAEYYNPYTRGLLFKSGAGLLIEEEPSRQSTVLQDRVGQSLTFYGEPQNPLDPHDETRVGGVYDHATLFDASETANQGFLARALLKGVHGLSLDMRLGLLDKSEEFILKAADSQATEESQLLLSNTRALAKNALTRSIGLKVQGYEQVLSSTNNSLNYQRFFDEKGYEVKIDTWTDQLTIITPAGDKVRLGDGGTFQGVELEDRAGGKVQCLPQLGVVQLTDNSGNKVEINDGQFVKLTRYGGTESITLGIAGISVNSLLGMRINGKAIAVLGDVTTTPAGPGSVTGASGGI